MKNFLMALCAVIASFSAFAGDVKVTAVTAQQRYPWNGLVDIEVQLSGTEEELSEYVCTFAATNVTTKAELATAHIEKSGEDVGSGISWTWHFVWDAKADVGAVKIDDVALTVGAKACGGVQLWENGPCFAECNVGATKPEEYGYYFWWGDTVGHKRNAANNGWVSVKDGSSFSFSSGNCPTYGKDNATLRSLGYIDSTGNLTAEHDAATAHLGAPWRMPTDSEFAALLNNCDTQWTTRNGVTGLLVTGKGVYASKSIFLPAGGGGYNSRHQYLITDGDYWTSTPDSSNPDDALYLSTYSSYVERDQSGRYVGQSVRPVRNVRSVINSVINIDVDAVTTRLPLDCREVRVADAAETLHYSSAWVTADQSAIVEIAANGEVINRASGSGMFEWAPIEDGSYCLTHTVKVNGVQVGEVLTVFIAAGNAPLIDVNGALIGYNGEIPEDLVIPDGVASIANGVFRDCKTLKSLTIPSSVEFIGDDAFKGCSSLTQVRCDAKMTAPGFHEAVFTDMTSFSDDNDIVANSSGIKLQAEMLTANTTAEYTMYGYAAYMWFEGGVTYEFLAGYDDKSSIKIDGEYLIRASSSDCYTQSASKRYDAAGWHWIELRGWNRSGRGSTNYGSNPGFHWRKQGENGWRLFKDDGDDSLFRAENRGVALNYLFVDSPIECVELGSKVNVISGKQFAGLSLLKFITIPSSVASIGEGAFEGCVNLDTIRVDAGDIDRVRNLVKVSGCDVAKLTFIDANSVVLEPFSVKSIEARQRYPWNGLVDITVIMQGTAEEIAEADWSLAATNSATQAAIPVNNITRNGADSRNGYVWTRKYIWDAKADVGAVKIDDVALTVDAKILHYVQLWENGPYWAKCNVGAAKPEEYGYYFWWGDTVGYKRNAANNGWESVSNGSSFSSFSGNCPTYGKSNSQLQSLGYIDSTGNLTAMYDAATVHLGAPWRMPTDAEFSALLNNCTTTWTTRNGVYGRLVTGKGTYASKSIFLPAPGYGNGSYLFSPGSIGYYWSSTPNSGSSYGAWRLYLNSDSLYRSNYYRSDGQSVRPVRDSAEIGSDGVGANAVTTRLPLDCREVRVANAAETLHYSSAWVTADQSAIVEIAANGEVINRASGSGMFEWAPIEDGSYRLTHTVKMNGIQVGEVLTACFAVGNAPLIDVNGALIGYNGEIPEDLVIPDGVASIANGAFRDCKTLKLLTIPSSVTQIGKNAFVFCSRLETIFVDAGDTDRVRRLLRDSGVDDTWLNFVDSEAVNYIRNVIARQLWPHNKVEISYEVAEDIGGVVDEDAELVVSCDAMRGTACTLIGDTSVKPGLHLVVWDLEADGIPINKSDVRFSVGYGEPQQGASSQDGLVHRWSFNGDLTDSVGGQTATAVGSVTTDGSQYSLAGGSNGSSYISLGSNILPVDTGATTIEIWATRNQVRNWARVIDIGSSTSDYIIWAWNNANYSYDDVGYNCRLDISTGGVIADNQECCFVIRIETLDNGDGQVTCNNFDVGTGALIGNATTFTMMNWSLSKMGQNSCYLGHSRFSSDSDASASYNEVRIWNYALSDAEIAEHLKLGPDALPSSVVAGVANGLSASIEVNTSVSSRAPLTVSNSAELGFSPIDTGLATIMIDGEMLLSATNSGSFVWQPKTTGEHTLEHLAGTNHWTRTVNVTSLAFAEPPTPNPPTEEDANIKLGADARSVVAAGGTVSITTSGSGTWNATTSADWITFNGASSKTAGLSCIVRVAANTEVESRTGYVYVSGHVFTITQAGVGAELESYTAEFGTEGGEGEVLVLVNGQTSWNVKPESDWISVRETSGTGEACVHFTVAPFAGVLDRTGYLMIAGRTYEVHQVGRELSISRLKDDFDYQSHAVEIDVTAFGTTEWRATPSADWISVVAPIADLFCGSGKVALFVEENPSYLARSAFVMIGTERYDVEQTGRSTEALTFSVSPGEKIAPAQGLEEDRIAVLATPGLPWTVESAADWLVVSSSSQEGTGNGQVVYAVAPNPEMSSRTGTIVITPEPDSGKEACTLAVTQAAPTASISSDAHDFAGEGGTYEVEVTVGDVVNWTIGGAPGESVLPDWVKVEGSMNRLGPGKVKITVDENHEIEPRSTIVTIAGKEFAITQRGRTVEVEYENRFFSCDGGDATLTVRPNGDHVNWTAVSSVPWITIWAEDGAVDNPDNSVSGSSVGTIGYYVEPYEGETRTGTITVGDKVVYITQAARIMVPITYTNLMGATHTNPATYEEGTSIEFSAPSAVDGYTFVGWEPAAITAEMKGDQTVKAIWKRDLCLVSVEAHQCEPCNGQIEIVVTLQGSEEELANYNLEFAATNSATKAALPIEHITQNGTDTGSGASWTRKFVWDAKADVGSVKIDDVALTVDAKTLGVQLWENGPYWAECNVGAEKPEEYGYYFWWGDTVGYKRNAADYGWVSVQDGSSFSFSSGNCPTYGKSNSQLQSAGYIDSTGNLTAMYDAATVHLGAPWRMPTDAEFAALLNNCDTQWTTSNGVYGRIVTGRGAYASKSIFLPAPGYGNGSSLFDPGSCVSYWSSTPDSGDSSCAWGLGFRSGYFVRGKYFRSFGHSVRPVRGSVESGGGVVVVGSVITHFPADLSSMSPRKVYTNAMPEANWDSLGQFSYELEDGTSVSNVSLNDTIVITSDAILGVHKDFENIKIQVGDANHNVTVRFVQAGETWRQNYTLANANVTIAEGSRVVLNQAWKNGWKKNSEPSLVNTVISGEGLVEIASGMTVTLNGSSITAKLTGNGVIPYCSGMQFDSSWSGVVKAGAIEPNGSSLNMNQYGIVGSKVEITSLSRRWLATDARTVNPTIVIPSGGSVVLNDFSENRDYVFTEVTGSGMFALLDEGPSQKVRSYAINRLTNFTGVLKSKIRYAGAANRLTIGAIATSLSERPSARTKIVSLSDSDDKIVVGSVLLADGTDITAGVDVEIATDGIYIAPKRVDPEVVIEGNEAVVIIPAGVDPSEVTVEIPADVKSVRPNGATIKVVKGVADITAFLDIPAAVDGVVNLGAAEVKEAIVKETMDTKKGAIIELSAENPTLTTTATKPGLTYTLFEGTTLDSMGAGASKLGDGTAWTPEIKVKGGASGFYSIKVTK